MKRGLAFAALLAVLVCCQSDEDPWYAGPYTGSGTEVLYSYFLDGDDKIVSSSVQGTYEYNDLAANIAKTGDNQVTLVIHLNMRHYLPGYYDSDIQLYFYLNGYIEGNKVFFPRQSAGGGIADWMSGEFELLGDQFVGQLLITNEPFLRYASAGYYDMTLTKL